jgi:anaerobic selenocysteine-containing dehydrogenase
MAASARSTWRRPASYTIGGAFWEFGQPDWERTKLFVCSAWPRIMTNPIKIGIGKLKERGARIRFGQPGAHRLFAVADDWIGITPGTDGLLILSL